MNEAVDLEAERKRAEAEFHDRREVDRIRLPTAEFEAKYPNKRFYSVTRSSLAYLSDWIGRHARDALVLDYCCGLGGVSVQAAREGGRVIGFDISEESVRTAARAALDAGVAGSTAFSVMDGETLAFDDASFDVIIVSGVLHHIDLDRAYRELSRVLRPGGRILCMEALAHNPLIDLYRRRTPALRTAWEVDHILKVPDVEKARKYFEEVEMRFFHLATILAVPFRRTPIFKPLLAVLEAVDAVVLRVPYLQRMAWQVFFELRAPRPAGGESRSLR